MRKFLAKLCPVVLAGALVFQMAPIAFAEEVASGSTALDISEMLKAAPEDTDGNTVTEAPETDAEPESESSALTIENIASRDEVSTEPDNLDTTFEAPAAEEQPSVTDEELATLAADALAQEVTTQDPAVLGYIPGQLLVGYKNEVSETVVDEALDIIEGDLEDVVVEYGDTTLATVSVPSNVDAEAIAEVVEQDENILYAEPNYYVVLSDIDEGAAAATIAENENTATLSATTNDTYASRLWHLDYIKAQPAWNVVNQATRNKVRVAVIDTGVNFNHQDLKNIVNVANSAEITISGTTTSVKSLRGDGYLNGTNIQNTTGHGTHVAGILAANANNRMGVAGVGSAGNTEAKNPIEIIAIDAFSSGSAGRESSSAAEIVAALNHAANKNCKVANLSLEFSDPNFKSDALHTAIKNFTNKGGTVVAAAGNSGVNRAIYPGAYPETIGVMNCTSSGARHSTSNYGSSYDLCAPGDNIYSTLGTSNSAYGYKTGTSMAAPMVAATAAMMYAVNPSMNASKVRSILNSTATDLGARGYDTQTGYGALNAQGAVATASGTPNAAAEAQYKYVYDYDSYLKYNPTLKNLSRTEAIQHFTTTGMNNGLQASDIFDPQYYKSTYSDLRSAFGNKWSSYYDHFLKSGMKEGRKGSTQFSLVSYYNGNADLRAAFGLNPASYYEHYVNNGKKEGRKATGRDGLQNLVGGTTRLNGKDYSAVYDSATYLAKNADVARAFTKKLGTQQVVDDAAVLKHFVNNGMKEGRTSSPNFDLMSYYNANPDLRAAFGLNPVSYYTHYMNYGKKEKRTATGVSALRGSVSTLNGKNYSAVYDSNYYLSKNPDVARAFTKKFGKTNVVDEKAALEHFVKYGMKEGRASSANFDLASYYNANPDLRAAFGVDPVAYYTHYMNYGQKEKRTATGVTALRGSMNKLNGKDYSAVYDSNYYLAHNPDVAKAFTKKLGKTDVVDEKAALNHFVKYGMKEGRASSPNFSWSVYRANNADLQKAFGNDTAAYYTHYMNYGKKEGRKAI